MSALQDRTNQRLSTSLLQQQRRKEYHTFGNMTKAQEGLPVVFMGGSRASSRRRDQLPKREGSGRATALRGFQLTVRSADDIIGNGPSTSASILPPYPSYGKLRHSASSAQPRLQRAAQKPLAAPSTPAPAAGPAVGGFYSFYVGRRRAAVARREGGSGRSTSHRSFTLLIPVTRVDPATDHELGSPSPLSPTEPAPLAEAPSSPPLAQVTKAAPLPPTPTLLPNAGPALEEGTLRQARASLPQPPPLLDVYNDQSQGPIPAAPALNDENAARDPAAPLPGIARRSLGNLNGLPPTPRGPGGLSPPPAYALPVPSTTAFRRRTVFPPPSPMVPSPRALLGGGTPVVIGRVVRPPMLDLSVLADGGPQEAAGSLAAPTPSMLPTARRSRLVRAVHGLSLTVDGVATQTTPDAPPGHRHMSVQMTPRHDRTAASPLHALVSQLNLEEGTDAADAHGTGLKSADGRPSSGGDSAFSFPLPELQHVTLRMPHLHGGDGYTAGHVARVPPPFLGIGGLSPEHVDPALDDGGVLAQRGTRRGFNFTPLSQPRSSASPPGGASLYATPVSVEGEADMELDVDPLEDQENIPPGSAETAAFGSQVPVHEEEGGRMGDEEEDDEDNEPLPLMDYQEEEEEGVMREGAAGAGPALEEYDYEGGGGYEEEQGAEEFAAGYDSFDEAMGFEEEEGGAVRMGPRNKRPKHWRLREEIMRRQSLAGNAFGLVLASPARGLRRSQRERQPAIEWWRMQQPEEVKSLEYSRSYRSLPTRKVVPEGPEPDPIWPAPSKRQPAAANIKKGGKAAAPAKKGRGDAKAEEKAAVAGKKRGRKQGRPKRIEAAAQEVTPLPAPRPALRTADATFDSFLVTPYSDARPAVRQRTDSPLGPLPVQLQRALEAAQAPVAPPPNRGALLQAQARAVPASPTPSRFSDSVLVQPGDPAPEGATAVVVGGAGAGGGIPPSPLEVASNPARGERVPEAMPALEQRLDEAAAVEEMAVVQEAAAPEEEIAEEEAAVEMPHQQRAEEEKETTPSAEEATLTVSLSIPEDEETLPASMPFMEDDQGDEFEMA